MNADLKLIRKYNVQGPRYTSYPTAAQFSEIGHQELLNSPGFMKDRKTGNQKQKDLSLYFHIPFCFSLCWYCGCTKIITKDSDRGDLYVDYLEKEMDLIVGKMEQESIVIQIHFGGGTPTFLSPKQLQRLGQSIHSRFHLDRKLEFSVEIDPRRCTREHIESLAAIGCNRASLGVQDTNPEVQKAIHRIQPIEETANVTAMLRENGINEINFDLIYGLPKQSIHTFEKTIHDILQLSPDRLAVYSYAHIPRLMPAQKLLNESDFPSAQTKLEMMLMSIGLLTEKGMRFIGMDHFVRKDDTLSKALDNGTLHRNFQGYSTHSETDMIAFGMSGISQFDAAYYQNTKDLGDYYKMLDKGLPPVVKKLELSRDDRIRKDLIMQIMCRANVCFRHFSKKWGIEFNDYFREDLYQLDELESDGLLVHLENSLVITKKGRLFLRNISMVFDAYFKNPGHELLYSKTV